MKAGLSQGDAHCLTTDGWTSCATDNFLTHTVHFINRDTWELQGNVLATCKSFESHTTENLSDVIKSVADRWSLKSQKLYMMLLPISTKHAQFALL